MYPKQSSLALILALLSAVVCADEFTFPPSIVGDLVTQYTLDQTIQVTWSIPSNITVIDLLVYEWRSTGYHPPVGTIVKDARNTGGISWTIGQVGSDGVRSQMQDGVVNYYLRLEDPTQEYNGTGWVNGQLRSKPFRILKADGSVPVSSSSSRTSTSRATSTSTSTSSSSAQANQERLSTGAKAGIGIGVVVAVLLVVFIIVGMLVLKKRRTSSAVKPKAMPRAGNDSSDATVSQQEPLATSYHEDFVGHELGAEVRVHEAQAAPLLFEKEGSTMYTQPLR